MNLLEIGGDRFRESHLQASVQSIQKRSGVRPRLGLILGSGWGGVRGLLQDAVSIPLDQVPFFPHPRVSGHHAELVLGRLGGQSLAILSGRKHLYEGEGLGAPLYSVEVFRRLGVEIVGLTNAAGAAQNHLKIGDLVVIRDHIDSTWHRFTAPVARLAISSAEWSAGQPVYDPELVERLLDAGRKEGLPVHSGIYGFTLGPFFETSVEVRCLGTWGCDALGMSTVPEAVYARLRGLRVFALSGITNMGTGLTEQRHSHETVKAQAAVLAPRATQLLARFVGSLN